MLWLNGGPGGSSIASGLLFENGPCRYSTDKNATVHNAYGWNEKVNIIYLDQPVGTGYSYGEASSTTLANLAADVYDFLQLFMTHFPEYAHLPLHIAGESWGGHYVPNIAHHIDYWNERYVYAPRPGQVLINLESVVLANGLTEPKSQFESMPEYLCGGAPYPPFEKDDRRCVAYRAAMPACLGMIDSCYRIQSNATCGPATAYCWPLLFNGPLSGERMSAPSSQACSPIT
jgi:cathepsin A (carboxypeptidase C)